MTDHTELLSIERRLRRHPLDFSETYVRVGQLKDLISGGQALASSDTVTVLARLLQSDQHHGQTQAFHFFNSIAGALALIVGSPSATAVSRKALQVLVPVAIDSRGEKQRATAETVGTLPVNIRGPREFKVATGNHMPRLTLAKVLARVGRDSVGGGVYQGRSYVCALAHSAEVLVIKVTRRGEDPVGLLREALWMDHLAARRRWSAGPFAIPRPLEFKGGFLFKPANLPGMRARCKEIDPSTAVAIAFTVDRDYFVYPNDHRPGTRLSYGRFRRVLLRAAGLFGELAGAGIVHTAPVPLFHNRVQRDRRDDGGVYEWDRGGRLDRWLQSSRFPNFGPTGIRDFEHMISVGHRDRRPLYRHIGNQLLSLILVSGSYFRCQAPHLVGFDENREPLDSRYLFDREKFCDLLCGAFRTYFTCFCNSESAPDMTAGIGVLVTRLIDTMGVDRHMREVLRVEDQNRMSAGEFRGFLDRYNFPAHDAAKIEKGGADIEVSSGPHLGEFNGPISVPELTAFLRSATAAIVAGRFRAQRFPGEKVLSHG